MNNCPAPGADPADGKWHGGYDWRYGSIRPQDNPSMALYPQIKAHIEEAVSKEGAFRTRWLAGLLLALL